jgi:hypothetical protein
LIWIILHISLLKERGFIQGNSCYKHFAPNGANEENAMANTFSQIYSYCGIVVFSANSAGS